MNRYRNTVTALFLLMLVCPAAQAAESCDERSGAAHIESGNLDSAYEMLRPCETKKNVSAETLTHLAILYGSLDYADLSEEEALKKVWQLLHRAAALGHQEALESITRLYAHGEPKIMVRPSADKSQCLDRIAKSGAKADQKSVEACLNR